MTVAGSMRCPLCNSEMERHCSREEQAWLHTCAWMVCSSRTCSTTFDVRRKRWATKGRKSA